LLFVEQQEIEPVIDAVYEFSKVPDALDHLDREPFGKIGGVAMKLFATGASIYIGGSITQKL